MSSPAQVLAFNRAAFATHMLAPFGFALYLVLAFKILSRQLKKARQSQTRDPLQKSYHIIMGYTIAMLCLVCIWFSTGAVNSEYLAVEIPFDPELQSALATCQPIPTIRTLALTLIIWLSDGILVWRTYIIWDQSKAVVSIPSLVYLASIGLGIAFELSCLGTDLGGPVSFSTTVNVALPFYALSIGLTVINTSLISYKLLTHRNAMKHGDLDTDDALATYTTVVSVLVESGFLYMASGIAFLVVLILRIPASAPMSVVFVCAAFIAPTLIQLRVVRGTAYSEESQLQFEHANSASTLNPIRFRSSTQLTMHQGHETDQVRVRSECRSVPLTPIVDREHRLESEHDSSDEFESLGVIY